MTNNAKAGGVLSIVAGALGIIWMSLFILAGVLMMVLPGMMGRDFYRSGGEMMPETFFTIMAAFYGIIGVAGILVGVVAIVGGLFALKKKYWGWALAGAICGTLVFFPCGIPAIIFVAMGKPEFQSDAPPAAPAPTIVG